MTIYGVIARVPYAPKADIPSRKFCCPLCAKSGHNAAQQKAPLFDCLGSA
jgi:hypothetical protein